jgi:hypothetical protein
MDDSQPETVKRKEAAFRSAESNDDLHKARTLANLWCAAFIIRKRFAQNPVVAAASMSPAVEPATPAMQLQTGLFGGPEEAPKVKTKKTRTRTQPNSAVPIGITTQHLRDFVEGDALPEGLLEEVHRLAASYQFFHWHLAFPEVFAKGGFDCVLGNPPWESLQTDPQEFFSASAPSIAGAANMAERNRLIDGLAHSNPGLHALWLGRQRETEAGRHFLRSCQRYPLSTYGRLNTYSLFAELVVSSIRRGGRCGVILPVGIATDAFNQFFFSDLIRRERLVSLFGFENEDFVFPQVHHAFKFALMTVGCDGASNAPELAFFLRSVSDLHTSDLRYRLGRSDFELINPNTVTCPVFRTRQDAAITALAYRRWPVILRENPLSNPWGVKCQLMFMMNTVSELTVTRDQLASEGVTVTPQNAWSLDGFVPLIEGKMFHQFDHRFGTYEGQTEAQANQGKLPELTDEQHSDPQATILPRYWLKDTETRDALGEYAQSRWLVSWRDVTSSVVFRTAIVAVLPFCATNDSAPLVHLPHRSAQEICSFVACLNSFALDFVVRQKLGGNHLRFFTFFQLPIVTPDAFESRCDWAGSPIALCAWILPRVLELTYTAWDLVPFAQDCGWTGPPFLWDEERRFLLRCEMDAAFFHLYLGSEAEWRQHPEALIKDFPTPRHAASYMMDTFPIVKRRDEERFNGDYRTKRIILEIYDSLAESIRTGLSYQTRLDPPPADPRGRHPRKKLGILAFGSLIQDPGPELEPRIMMRIKTLTPFPVEYARISGKTRGGAPTLVPHENGSPVSAEILVLDDNVSVDEARNMLWRRETRKAGSCENYAEGTSPNSVLVREIDDSPCVSTVLYTDFPADGKIGNPTAEELARRAIQSVGKADERKDGISYLMDNMACGIETPLTSAYREEILKQTEEKSLEEALTKGKVEVRGQQWIRDGVGS